MTQSLLPPDPTKPLLQPPVTQRGWASLFRPVIFAALMVFEPSTWAENYPLRPVRMVVPYAPGGITDTFARHMAQGLTEYFTKQFHVENMAGGSGNTGTAAIYNGVETSSNEEGTDQGRCRHNGHRGAFGRPRLGRPASAGSGPDCARWW